MPKTEKTETTNLPKLTVKTKLTTLSLEELEQAIGGSAADGDSFGGSVEAAMGRTSSASEA